MRKEIKIDFWNEIILEPIEDDRIFKTYGEGENIYYAKSSNYFGECIFFVMNNSLIGISFYEPHSPYALDDFMRRRLPRAKFIHDTSAVLSYSRWLNSPESWEQPESPNIQFVGTYFQKQVWKELLRIKMGDLSNYSKIASALGKPSSYRAVANAIGNNPLALIVPCHRVISKSGAISGYRWGTKRKQQIIDWEKSFI